MSYILNALTRADRERRRIASPAQSATAAPPRAGRTSAWWWALPVLVTVNAAALGWMLWPGRPPATSTVTVEQAEPRATAQESPRLPAPPARVERDIAISSPDPVAVRPVVPEQAPMSSSPVTTPTGRIPAAPPKRPAGKQEFTPAKPRRGTADPGETIRQRPAKPAPAARSPAKPDQVTMPPAVAALPAPSAALPPAPEPRRIASDPAPPNLKLDVLVYAEGGLGSMVFINNRKYVVGDVVDGTFKLDAITAEGAVLSSEGRRFLLRGR